MNKTVFIEHRVDNLLTNAFSVTLADKNSVYGIKTLSGDILVPTGTTVTNPSTGLYQYTADFLPNIIYVVSWKIISSDGEEPNYIQQEIGPFTEVNDSIRAVADFRGVFKQSEYVSLFLRITNMEGNAINAETITIDIKNPSGTNVNESTREPEIVQDGFYAYDWEIPYDAETGQYSITWTYTIDNVTKVEIQTLIVSANPDQNDVNKTYAGVQVVTRQSLTNLIMPIQAIPVYREPAKPSRDNKTFEFTFPRWNQSAGVRIFRNDILVNNGITVDYFKGKVTFDNSLTDYDKVEASYNFRYFSDEQLDTFYNNALQMYNLHPPFTSSTVYYLSETWTPTVLYGAAIDAIRAFLLAIQFQEIQLILGNADAAGRVFGNLESLKKNYEGSWTRALDQKKLGPYKGLTRTIVTPSFAIPGARSRWFRYIFSGGSS